MTWKLWLDDVRNPPDDTWKTAKTIRGVVDLVYEFGIQDLVEMSLDHDLGEEDGCTGLEALDWLTFMEIPTSVIVHFHSMNPVGRQRMENLWNDYKNKEEK